MPVPVAVAVPAENQQVAAAAAIFMFYAMEKSEDGLFPYPQYSKHYLLVPRSFLSLDYNLWIKKNNFIEDSLSFVIVSQNLILRMILDPD